MSDHTDKHIFACYVDQPLTATPATAYAVMNASLAQRITQVLRLRAGEQVQLFNGEVAITLALDDPKTMSKNQIRGYVVTAIPTVQLAPAITLLQCMPKKSVFEEIVYNAAQLGVNSIVPVRSAKSQELAFTPKEQERLRNIMIAACEQAKQFILPTITASLAYEQALARAADAKIVFDATGAKVVDQIGQYKQAGSIAVLFGSEAGLTQPEIEKARSAGFVSTRLTRSILRSEDAPLLGIGLLRTLI
jgi:16S rRNA (uracil1498-N3)-methyltransferase